MVIGTGSGRPIIGPSWPEPSTIGSVAGRRSLRQFFTAGPVACPYVGARLSGLLATYPVFAAVLTAFSHHGRGPAAAVQVLRGLLIGLYAFIGFFAVLASTIERAGIAASFAAATVVALAIQGCSLWLMRRR